MIAPYRPTHEQLTVIHHSGSAFITACPGAGKTRTLVERARQLLQPNRDRRGVAFLSFTNAAVNELQARLQAFGVMPRPLFPSFIGTFDSFLWQFLTAPFGIPGSEKIPKLIPDKDQWEVKPPYDGAQPLRLRCFDRATGKVNATLAQEEGFDVQTRSIKAHESTALRIIEVAKRNGYVDFEDVRLCITGRLSDLGFSQRIGTALAMRFREIVVDEAQDCNAADLAIIDWLRRSGITVKVICDPNQAIYQFRGGVTDELQRFAETFLPEDRLSMSGNFRSTQEICSAVNMLRPPARRTGADTALGEHRSSKIPIHIISYPGSAVSSAIAMQFRELVRSQSILLHASPVLAATRASAAKAIGEPAVDPGSHLTLLLATAVMTFHFDRQPSARLRALTNLHRIVLLIQGRIQSLGNYHTYVEQEKLEARWRPEIIELAQQLGLHKSETPDQWLNRARTWLAPSISGSRTINQRLRATSELEAALALAPVDMPPYRTIHSAKGMEFPAVCVILTTGTAGGIIKILEGNTDAANELDEDARKIYVAASRAEHLLAMAVPKSQSDRLAKLLKDGGCNVAIHPL